MSHRKDSILRHISAPITEIDSSNKLRVEVPPILEEQYISSDNKITKIVFTELDQSGNKVREIPIEEVRNLKAKYPGKLLLYTGSRCPKN